MLWSGTYTCIQDYALEAARKDPNPGHTKTSRQWPWRLGMFAQRAARCTCVAPPSCNFVSEADRTNPMLRNARVCRMVTPTTLLLSDVFVMFRQSRARYLTGAHSTLFSHRFGLCPLKPLVPRNSTEGKISRNPPDSSKKNRP